LPEFSLPGLFRVLPSAPRYPHAGIEEQNGAAALRFRSGQIDLLVRFPNREMRCHPAGSSGVSAMTIVALGILAVVILFIVLTAVNGSHSPL
jgi:hypothetical protein